MEIAVGQIVVRRRQNDTSRTAREIVVAVMDKGRAAMALREILCTAQRDRGRGLWSDADPEILVDGSVIGRLRKHEIITELVEHVLRCACPDE
jgi:hypothetical protein